MSVSGVGRVEMYEPNYTFKMTVTSSSVEKAIDVAGANARLAFPSALRINLESVEATPFGTSSSTAVGTPQWSNSLYNFSILIGVYL